jgi:hypothetical protein
MIKRIKEKKIIGLSGTPIIKFPYSLVPFFNLAHDNTTLFRENFDEWNEKYLLKKDNGEYTILNKDVLLRKLDGLIAYVPTPNTDSGTPKLSKLNIVKIEMSEPQYIQYISDYKLELEEISSNHRKNVFNFNLPGMSTYHLRTFQDCVYYNKNLLHDGSNNAKTQDRYKGIKSKKDIIINKIYCPKIVKMYEDSKSFEGIVMYYFRFTTLYGVEGMSKCLEDNGYKLVNPKITEQEFFSKPQKQYVIFSGDTSDYRNYYKYLVNHPKNCDGKYIDRIIVSNAGSIGISFKNVRLVSLGSVFFNYSALIQMVGRARRISSHIDLPPHKRNVTQILYLMEKNKRYYTTHEKELKDILSRKAHQFKEIAPSIETIIYSDSVDDNQIVDKFNTEILIKASITEKIYNKF